MQRGRGRRDDFLGFGDPFGGFGGFGGFGRPGSLISDFFGGRNPFDDPFFSQPFGSMMGPSFFGPVGSIFGSANHATHGGFLEHEPPPQNKSKGPIIKELNSDGDDDDEGDGEDADKNNNDNLRKHLRSGKEPYVEYPDEEIGERKAKHVHRTNELNRAAKRPQTNSYFFQSSTVSYGGPNGPYYSSSTTRRAADGVVMEENKEADSNTGKATHRISRGVYDKGHSVTRKLNSDGNVETLQTLHNLNEDELPNFEDKWKGKTRQFLPEWKPAIDSGFMSTNQGRRNEGQSSNRLALPSMASAQPHSMAADRIGGQEFQPQTHRSVRSYSQARPNPSFRRFN
ncbi:hypothetical protein AXF42_Ash018989 [Apostasia shenzhenica]|uniref:Myeloid leukemia factor 1 n=1 Tax=Apostasia shenzhenica TaxID=1088818 RepID=A0A2I0AC09_9ASPA|nr:hypothetical protein AXF42_Ash018989 [Apostasia shenzhenica]